MTEKLIGEMNNQEFEQMMEAFIDRPAPLDDEIPAELVFTMIDQVEKPKHLLELESIVVDNRLVISALPNVPVPTNVREIEINLLNVRLIVQVEPAIVV